MIGLIDCSMIINKHYDNLLINSNKLVVFILFFVVPTIIGLVIILLNKVLAMDIVNNLLVAFTIFTAFLPNVIFIQIGMRKSIEEDKFFAKDARDVSQYLYTDSVYSLLISVIILTILIAMIIFNNNNLDQVDMGISNQIISLIVYTLIVHFLITFFMVIQRVFILFFPTE